MGEFAVDFVEAFGERFEPFEVQHQHRVGTDSKTASRIAAARRLESGAALSAGRRLLGFALLAGRRFGLLFLGGEDPLIELVDPTGRIDQLLLSGKKRMAGRADLNVDLFEGRTGRKDVAAGAVDTRFAVPGGVDLLFHSGSIITPVASRTSSGALRLALFSRLDDLVLGYLKERR
ncbi:MAG: hypothetical protein ACREM8_10035 [Vulcanimicrobiaceae bacterium]